MADRFLRSEYSPFKSLHHVDRLKAGTPVFCQWDLTNKCNHRCRTCYSNFGERFQLVDEWPLEDALRFCNELKELGVAAVELTGGGEPTVYKHLETIIRRLYALGIEVAMVTNGVRLPQVDLDLLQRLEWLRISIDALDRKTYEFLRQRPWKLDATLALIPEIKARGCILGSSFVVQRENIMEINGFAVWSREKGFDNVHFSCNWEPGGFRFTDAEKAEIRRGFSEVSLLSDEAFRVFKFAGRLEQEADQPRNYEHCYKSDLVFIAAASGELYRCSHLKNTEQGYLGSYRERSLRALWEARGEQDVSKCPVCWRNRENAFMTYLMAENPKHKNFV